MYERELHMHEGRGQKQKMNSVVARYLDMYHMYHPSGEGGGSDDAYIGCYACIEYIELATGVSWQSIKLSTQPIDHH